MSSIQRQFRKRIYADGLKWTRNEKFCKILSKGDYKGAGSREHSVRRSRTEGERSAGLAARSPRLPKAVARGFGEQGNSLRRNAAGEIVAASIARHGVRGSRERGAGE